MCLEYIFSSLPRLIVLLHLLMKIYCVCAGSCVCVCVWGQAGHFLWPVWHLTHAVTSFASFSVSLTSCSASGTEKSGTLSSTAHTQHLLCFCLLCSPTEAAAGEGDRPEDSGGRSQWCKWCAPKIYLLSVCNTEKRVSCCAVIVCISCVWPHGTGITVIPICLGIHIAPAASVVQPNTNLPSKDTSLKVCCLDYRPLYAFLWAL